MKRRGDRRGPRPDRLGAALVAFLLIAGAVVSVERGAYGPGARVAGVPSPRPTPALPTRIPLDPASTLALAPPATDGEAADPGTVTRAGAGTPLALPPTPAPASPTPVPTLAPSPTPYAARVLVVDGATGAALAGARVQGGDQRATSDEQGAARVEGAPLRGVVRDAASGQPIGGAFVGSGSGLEVTGADGSFRLAGVAGSGPVWATAPGYRRGEAVAGADGTVDLRLEPFAARGLYLSFFGVADTDLREHVLDLLDRTEANALVLDVKGDRGYLAYRSSVPLAEAIGANDLTTVPDIAALLSLLRERGIYTIARIVVFKDDRLARNGARAGLDLAVHNRRDGEVWLDGEGLGWVDPFRPEVWEYNVALAREAISLGFDEVQFDYMRFPTDAAAGGSVEEAVYSQESTAASRTEAIDRFLGLARRGIKPLGGYLSVDAFGYVCWRDDDMGIGQQLERLSGYVDYLSPMVYPSTFAGGLPSDPPYPDAVGHPYEVVYHSLARARQRLAGHSVVLRPWLQYFDDYPWVSGRPYRAPEIAAQIQGAAAAGASGWLLWDPANRYAHEGLAAER